jgi:hypothetical protein
MSRLLEQNAIKPPWTRGCSARSKKRVRNHKLIKRNRPSTIKSIKTLSRVRLRKKSRMRD